MKRPWIVATLSTLAVLAGLGVAIWAGALPLDLGGPPAPVALGDLTVRSGHVVTEGTAHYPVRVSQAYAATLLRREQRTLHIFPLFPTHDSVSREVHVMVLTERDPDRLLGFEDLTVAGHTHRPSSRWLSRGVLDTFRDHGYTFPEDFVLLVEDPPGS
ncbi:MAG: hypothetical protein ABIO70_36265 [Pseudomonadota bacterium]